MLREALKSETLDVSKEQYLELLRRDIEESINDPRPGIPHEQVMEEMSRYVEEKVRHHLARTRTF